MKRDPGTPPQQVGLGWALLSVAVALPWLIEAHSAPWTNFYADGAMAAVLLPLAAWTLLRAAGWQLGALTSGVAALALVPLVQAANGRLGYPSEGVVSALFLLGFALAVLVGSRAEDLAPGRLADALFAGLFIASVVSVALQLYQWLGLHQLGALVVQVPIHGRPAANVAQPNLLATLLVWGLLATWWAHEHGRIGRATAVFAVAFLLFGTALTQSRTGWAEVALLAVFAASRGRSLSRPVSAPAVAGLMALFVAFALVLPLMGSLMGLEPMRALESQSSAGKRPAIWALGLDAIATKPWLGWGWNQGAVAHVALADRHPSIQILTPYMHNVVLDLLLWNGILIGALAVIGGAVWFVRRWRADRTASSSLLLLALAVLLVHAMLELPHGHAMFLLPAGLMIGIVERRGAARAVLVLPRWAVGAVAASLAGALVVFAVEFHEIEDALVLQRLHAAKIANLPPLGAVPRPWLLAPYGDLLASLRVVPAPSMDGVTLDALHRTAYHFPSTPNLLRLAHADALNGRPDDARAALRLLCDLRPATECQWAGDIWRQLGSAGAPALSAIEPPGPGLGSPLGAGAAATIARPDSAGPEAR